MVWEPGRVTASGMWRDKEQCLPGSFQEEQPCPQLNSRHLVFRAVRGLVRKGMEFRGLSNVVVRTRIQGEAGMRDPVRKQQGQGPYALNVTDFSLVKPVALTQTTSSSPLSSSAPGAKEGKER